MDKPYPKGARALIEAAERLIATQGLGVPLREIGQVAGAANKVAVQYHFGDRQRLIEAVFEYRLPELEEERATRLADADRNGELANPATLLDVLLRPIAELADGDGRRSYAGFLYQLTANARSARAAFDPLAPTAKQIVKLLRDSLPQLTKPIFDRRLGSASLIFLDTIQRLEEQGSVTGAGIDEALALSLAVLTAPVE